MIKKYLAMILSMMLITSFVSCGNTQESSSEPSESVSEVTTEEPTTEEPTTEPETIITEISTTQQSYVLPELDETYEDKNIIFKYSSKWEKETEESLRNKAYFKINDNFEIRIFENDSEYSTNAEFIAAEEKEYKKKNKEYKIYETANGNQLLCYTEEATKSKKFFANTSYISFYNYSPEYDELINLIIDTVLVKDDVYQKNNPRVFSENLDKTFDNEDISFKYSSEWDENIKIMEEYGYLSAEFMIDPLNEFQIRISVEPVPLDYSSNDEFIVSEEEDFKKCNEKYEIFITDSGDKLIYSKVDTFDNTNEVRRFRAYNGKQIWIYIENYSSQYDDIIKKIINTVDIKENFEKTTEKPTSPPVTVTESPVSDSNALKMAKSYINMSGFSYEGLIGQLEFEGFSHDEAVSAADICGADWNEEALESAKSYISMSGFSYSGLIEQLEFEKFTHEQAVYGADNCGADWNQQAADSAQSYMNFMSMSRDELIDQLIYEGFTQEQAEYGVQSVGY